VLYSRKHTAWKLTDFGLSSEATSRTLRTTNLGRATEIYTAPELMSENPRYNNKIDIWGMGCVLYELAVGKAAFANSFARFQYINARKKFKVDLNGIYGKQYGAHITRNIISMLRLEPSSRPSAFDLLTEFSRQCQSIVVRLRADDEVQKLMDVDAGLASQIRHAIKTEERNRIDEIIKQFQKAGVNVSATDKLGLTRLHKAAEAGDIYTIRALKELGADMSAQAGDGSTPMHCAALYGYVDAIKTLKELGADVSAQDKSGWTPMHRAAWNEHVDAMKTLKELGADVSAQNKDGWTPILCAARDGRVDAIKTLKELGADISA
jgi:Protein kinase domain/Ankyrin repeats (many copies)/Ankyrin repeat